MKSALKINPKILYLPIKKEWFDMILSGKKKEEYRETSNHWNTRLVKPESQNKNIFYLKPEDYKHYDVVKFTNGYNEKSPSAFFEVKNIKIGYGWPILGAPRDRKVFIIELGSRVEFFNTTKLNEYALAE